MLSNISDLFTMASLVICMLLSGIIFYYLRTRISMLEQSVMDQAQLLQQVVTSLKTVQYRQMNANASSSVVTAHQQQNGQERQEGQQEGQQGQEGQNQMNLIQVSDDGESSDSDVGSMVMRRPLLANAVPRPFDDAVSVRGLPALFALAG